MSAKLVTRPVAYEHDGVRLEGFLAYDDTKVSQRSPGVLVLPEWWGLTDYPRSRARQLAQLGYIAFAADMYGAGVTTTDAKKAGELARQFYGKPLMAERARAGLDQLLATGLVAEGQVAAVGYCFGGSTAQVLAYSGAPLAGIVSFHGGLVPASAEAAARNRARFLVCHGAVDPFVSAEEIAAFMKSMNEGKFDYQVRRRGARVLQPGGRRARPRGGRAHLVPCRRGPALVDAHAGVPPRNLRRRPAMSRLKVYHLPQCSTCKGALKWLRARGVDFEERSIKETPPTAGELRAMLAAQGGEWRRVFNTSGLEYRGLGLAEKLPNLGEREKLSLLTGNGMLVRRPFVIGPGVGLVGFDEEKWAAALAPA